MKSADMPFTVLRLAKYVRLFWAIAILLMAGGQLAHGYHDYDEMTHSTSCEESDHHSDQKSDSPLAGHECCHTHSHSVSVVTDLRSFEIFPSLIGVAFAPNDSFPDGPVEEIDYPPQLS